MKAMPHPTDWGIGQWSFEGMSIFISARNREVKTIAARLRADDFWMGHEEHADPFTSIGGWTFTSAYRTGGIAVWHYFRPRRQAVRPKSSVSSLPTGSASFLRGTLPATSPSPRRTGGRGSTT